jgi:tetratricopeptide (TPR) repeat protein
MDFAEATRLYAEVFAEAGLGRVGDDVATMAARVIDSPLHTELVGALDEWASVSLDPPPREWLLAVVRRADPEPSRNRLRQPELWRNGAELTELAREVPAAELSPQFACARGRDLRRSGGDAEPLLRAAQARFPNDFWLNHYLGLTLYEAKRWDEAIGFNRAAVALRPEVAAAHASLAAPLHAKGQLDEAIAQCQDALRLDPKYALAHYNLGAARYAKGQLDEAIAEYQDALRLDPEFALAHHGLGAALQAQGQLDEAIAEYQDALRLDPKYALAHYNLGAVLHARGQLDEAIAEYRRATELDPGGGLGHEWLAEALLRSGRFTEARTAVRRALDVLPTRDPHRPDLQEKLKLGERLLALDARAAAILQGQEKPGDAAQQLEAARLCKDYARPYAAALFYAGAFGAQPALAKDLMSGNRYYAACAASRAAAAPDSDEARLGVMERARLRRQALDWLRADLALRTELQKGGESQGWVLRIWLQEANLAGVRDPASLEMLPEEERHEWQRLWADVAAIVAADPLAQGQASAARQDWAKAADAYARALKRGPTDNGHFWFEYAALLLLSDDRPGYARACGHMVEKWCKSGGPRAYHVARACTLAPDAVADAALPGRLAETELLASAKQFWSLTEQGALAYRAGRYQESASLFEQSLKADATPGRAVVNWLWLALAQQRLGKAEEAQRWLGKAQAWLDQYRDGMPARAEQELGLHLHNWLEAHVLRREAETLLQPTDRPSGTENRERGAPPK